MACRRVVLLVIRPRRDKVDMEMERPGSRSRAASPAGSADDMVEQPDPGTGRHVEHADVDRRDASAPPSCEVMT
jgi:hypothetical protein